MQNLHVYDTSTQAMTEVALALSMAFFALLIVALLSFQLPQEKNQVPADTAHKVDETEKIQIENTSAKTSAKAESQQLLFFYQGKFVDQQLKSFALEDLPTKQAVVLAVHASLAFSEVMSIRQKINHPNLSITLINEEWQAFLEQTMREKTL